jgi:selenide,water dikinase
MTTLNAAAADAIRPFEPSAVTDVTGFGLLGHALEVAERSGVRVVLEATALPALDGATEAAAGGLRTGGDTRNRDFAGASVDLDGHPDGVGLLGYDPQTSGGLLVALAPEKGAVLEATFRSCDLFLARVGRIEEGAGVAVV